MSRRLSFIAVVAVAAWLVLPGVARAEPKVLSSNPAEGQTMHRPPSEVSITFDMPLDPDESTIVVVDGCGRRIDDDNPQVLGNQITVGIAKTPSGTYDMQYRAVPPAGATGTGAGSIKFSVHLGRACRPEARGHSGHGALGDRGGDKGAKDSDGDHSGIGSGHSGQGSAGPSGHTGSSRSSASGATHLGSNSGSSHSGRSVDPAEGRHGNHGAQGGNEGGGAGGSSVQAAPAAAPDLPSAQSIAATGTAVLMALGICASLGMGGGYLLRQGRSPLARH